MERPQTVKESHEAVKYENESKQPRETCSRCQHFIDEDPARCDIVVSPIEPEGWCEKFRVDPGKLTHEEYREYREKGGGKEKDEASIANYRASREASEGERSHTFLKLGLDDY